MQEKKTSLLSNAMIWFGAAVSIAEIMTGTILAPLGFSRGLMAIIAGHVIGCALLFFSGLIGARTGKSAMETAKMSFGSKGSLLFSVLNVLQLVGWTAVMIAGGASAAAAIVPAFGNWGWCLIIGVLIIIWILIGMKNLNKVNLAAMTALFVLTIVLSVIIFKNKESLLLSGAVLSFGAALELSIAMPLSWLPLISDYTRNAKKPFATTLTSAAIYFAASCWMYTIGLGAALFAAESDIASIMLKAGLGIAALIIIIFSTVTTTFLDAYSAGVSVQSISAKLTEKSAAIIVGLVGMLLAIAAPVSQFENFLYLISSVFAPMISILIVNFFLIKNDCSTQHVSATNLTVWFFGFFAYRFFMNADLAIGSTIPAMMITGILCVIANSLLEGKKDDEKYLG